jgi:transcription elongation factor Elf1
MSFTDYDYVCPECEENTVTKREDGTAHCSFCLLDFDADQAATLKEADNDPGDMDGETFRGGEAAAFNSERMASYQRIK